PGLRLRALVRDPAGARAQALQKDGVEVVAGDLEEPDTLTEAFEGVDIMWLLTPASALEPSMGSNAVTAARKAKVGYIVRNSAIKAGHDAPNRNGRLHALVEESVKASGIPWTILRPHYYMQNLLSSAASVASDGMLYMNMGQGRVGMIDGRDVGVFGAKIIEQTDRHAGKTYTPTGPEVTTMAESAETLSSLLGKQINYVALPPEAAQQAMLGFGLSRWFVGNVVDYGRVYSDGWGDFTTSDFKDITGQEARSFKQFATDFAPAFGGSPVAAHA
ncbi:MAG TPA: NmrA family NAD(P)-binding protein, partial [Candidatus Nitrosopolaris sp.]|nr:NmrA family NAD(P)-binding protein [Candidatus Nitrosopolaris sp.]